jgi:hypothetical protein
MISGCEDRESESPAYTLNRTTGGASGALCGSTALRGPDSGVEFAAYFVAVQAGGVERIRHRHHPTPNGLCAGCLATPTMHPCQAARIAELAQQRAEYRAEYRGPMPMAEIVPRLPTSPRRPSTTGRRIKHRRRRR